MLMTDLKEGDPVMFGVAEGEMGPQATYVRAEKGGSRRITVNK